MRKLYHIANEIDKSHYDIPKLPMQRLEVLMKDDVIVSSASSWKITDERSAIENIFTAPQYRGLGMAKLIITYTLEQIRKEGFQIATLSMHGRNYKASNLYQSLGFTLYYNQIEMLYQPRR